MATITSDTLQNQTPINYTTPNQVPIPAVPDPAPLTATPTETQANDLTTRLQDLNNSLIGKSAYQTSQENAAGLPALNKNQQDLTTQLQQLKNESLAIPQQLQLDATGRGITAGGLAPLQTARLRTNAIQALGVSSLLDATNGLISSAQQKVDRAVKAQYDPIQEQIDAATKNLNLILNSPQYSLEEKNRAQAQLNAQNAKQKQLDKAKQDSATIQSWAAAALTNGATPLQAQQILQIGQSDVPDLNAAFKLYAPFAKDPMATQKALLDLQQQRLGITKTKAEINKLNADAQAAVAADATVNPDVLQGMLNVYKSTGVLPAFGMSGKSPLRAQFYAALGGENGSQIVSDANTNKSIRAGLNTAYKTQQNLLSANQTAIKTLDSQLNLAQQYSDKVSRSDSPFVNKYLLAAKSGVFGDPDTAAFNNIVKTASYEFAKILSGSSASIAGTTISSAADAEQMLNNALTKGQFSAVIDLMRKEADFRLNSKKDRSEET